MTYVCPVCGYDQLWRPPKDYLICPSCGTEFEYDDLRNSHLKLRRLWLIDGAKWHSNVVPRPTRWDPFKQLKNVGVIVDA